MKYSEAASAYETALFPYYPKLPGIELNLGLAEFKQGRFDAAIPTFHAVLGDESPQSAGLYTAGA